MGIFLIGCFSPFSPPPFLLHQPPPSSGAVILSSIHPCTPLGSSGSRLHSHRLVTFLLRPQPHLLVSCAISLPLTWETMAFFLQRGLTPACDIFFGPAKQNRGLRGIDLLIPHSNAFPRDLHEPRRACHRSVQSASLLSPAAECVLSHVGLPCNTPQNCFCTPASGVAKKSQYIQRVPTYRIFDTTPMMLPPPDPTESLCKLPALLSPHTLICSSR